MTSPETVRDFFDHRADRWDSIVVHPQNRIDHVLGLAGDMTGWTVLDVGSGTGILVGPLLSRVGRDGMVVAIDVAPRMIEVSRRKHTAPNLEFRVDDFLTMKDGPKADLVVAYSCFPHFSDHDAFMRAATGNLAAGGRLLIAHIESRHAINALHTHGAAAVSNGLPPVAELATVARAHGFEILATEDSDQYYALYARLGS